MGRTGLTHLRALSLPLKLTEFVELASSVCFFALAFRSPVSPLSFPSMYLESRPQDLWLTRWVDSPRLLDCIFLKFRGACEKPIAREKIALTAGRFLGAGAWHWLCQGACES